MRCGSGIVRSSVTTRKAVDGLCNDAVQPPSAISRSSVQLSGYWKKTPSSLNCLTMTRPRSSLWMDSLVQSE